MAENRVYGVISCPVCGCGTAQAKELNSGAFIVCPPMHDGGCNTQVFGRSRAARSAIAKKVTKWNDPEVRKEILGGDPVEKPARKATAKARAEAPVMPEPEAPEPNELTNPPPRKDKEILGGLLKW